MPQLDLIDAINAIDFPIARISRTNERVLDADDCREETWNLGQRIIFTIKLGRTTDGWCSASNFKCSFFAWSSPVFHSQVFNSYHAAKKHQIDYLIQALKEHLLGENQPLLETALSNAEDIFNDYLQ